MAGITDDMIVTARLFGEACRKAGAQRPTGVYYDPDGGVSIDMADRDGNAWSFAEGGEARMRQDGDWRVSEDVVA